MAKTVGIVDYSGQAHCAEHASTVSSYAGEIHTTDFVRHCWCGKKLGGRKTPTPSIVSQYRTMNDGVKGARNASGIIPSRTTRRHK